MSNYNYVLIPFLLLQSPLLLAENETISTRIVGGQQSTEGQWPWIVSVSAGGYACGGTLINSNTVLTAAHCLFDENKNAISINDITVAVGEYDKTSQPATPRITILKKDIHGSYNPDDNGSGNDIALLHLTTPVTGVTPIDLLDVNSANNAVNQESDVTTIGWGSTVGYAPSEQKEPEYPSILREVELPLQTDAMCSSNLGSSYDANTMICAGLPQGGTDACQGDSGGPLVYNDAGTWKQIGVVSWGAGCASAGNPGVYTRLANYADWIANLTNTLAIDNQLTFPYLAINNSATEQLLVTNNASEEAQLTFSLSGSDQFSYAQDTCTVIAPDTSCSLAITYNATTNDTSQATLSIDSNLADVDTLTTIFTGTPLTDIDDIANQADFANTNTQWSTGGDALWELQANSNILQTHNLLDAQETVLIATMTGNGRLQFDWSVSSESGYDLLALIINDKVIDTISGSVSFKAKSYFLDKEVNKVVWRYKKDAVDKRGNDQAYLTKATFETMTKAEYELQIANETIDGIDIIDGIDEIIDSLLPSSSGGGGGSLLFIFSIPLLFIRRYFKK